MLLLMLLLIMLHCSSTTLVRRSRDELIYYMVATCRETLPSVIYLLVVEKRSSLIRYVTASYLGSYPALFRRIAYLATHPC
jgi:uncharacterized membrane protein